MLMLMLMSKGKGMTLTWLLQRLISAKLLLGAFSCTSLASFPASFPPSGGVPEDAGIITWEADVRKPVLPGGGVYDGDPLPLPGQGGGDVGGVDSWRERAQVSEVQAALHFGRLREVSQD